MKDAVIADAPSAQREARSKQAEPAARICLDDGELARIIRIVRATLEAGSVKEKEEKRAVPLWRRGPFCLEHGALAALAASVLMVIGAAIGYRASPFYWLKQIAVADKEFDLKQNKFKARHAARLVPKLSAGDATGVTHLIRYDLTLLVQRRGDLDARAQRFAGWWEPRLAGRQ